MTIRFRLRELLEAQTPPLGQSELARRSGVSFVTVNAIANNRTAQIKLATLDALCTALGCEPGELLARGGGRTGKRTPRSRR